MKIFSGFILVSLILLSPAHAAENDVDRAKKEYIKIQKEIKQKKTKLSRAGKKEKKIINELHRTSKKLVDVSRELKRYKGKLDGTRKEASRVRNEIEALKKKIETKKEWLKRKIVSMHRRGKFGDALLVLSASEDVSQAIRRWRYMETLASLERQEIEEFRSDIAALDTKRKRLDSIYEKFEQQRQKVLDTERKLRNEKKKKQSILASVRKRKSDYKKLLRELRSSSEMLLKIIKSSEMASKRTTGRGFRKRKGRLSWPISGSVAIPYGSQRDPKFKTPVFRNGIYVSAPDDAVVRAAHKGKVVFADWFKGYGQLIILNHGGGYHTLYANLSEIFLKTGDIIEERAEMGRVGSSGLLNRPSLYFEIRYKGKTLDPTQWLEKKIARNRK